MSINDTIGNAVGAGMAAGLAVGIRNQNQRAVDSWKDYASDLEAEIRNLKAQVAHKQAKISQQEETIEEKEARLKKLSAKLEDRVEIAQSDFELLNFVSLESRQLKKDLTRASSDSRVLHALYERLLSEVNELSDPRLFASLDPQIRLSIMREEWEEFNQSGETKYEVKLTHPDKQQLGEKIDELSARAAKLKKRNELINFLSQCAGQLISEMPSLPPEQTEAPMLYYEKLVQQIKDASDLACYEAMDPVAALIEAQDTWRNFPQK